MIYRQPAPAAERVVPVLVRSRRLLVLIASVETNLRLAEKTSNDFPGHISSYEKSDEAQDKEEGGVRLRRWQRRRAARNFKCPQHHD